MRAVARAGEAAPGGGTFDRFGQDTLPVVAPVNAKGEVAFFARLSHGTADEGIFLRRGERVLTVARQGDRVPGIGRLSGFGKHPTPALSDTGMVVFAAAVAGGRAVEGIFAWSAGRVRPVALTGTPAPAMPASALAGLDSPAINSRGDIVFLAAIRHGRESVDAILLSAGGALRKVVSQGDPAPAGGTFAAFGPPVINASGAVAFAAVVEGKAVPGGLFVAKGEHIEMVVGAGDDTPIGGIFAKFSERIGLNDSGIIAFHGMLKFAPVDAAIFAVEDGRLRAVSRLGDGAPGGGTISHFGLWPAVGSQGAIAFVASIEGGSSPMAILLTDGPGLTRVAAVGDTLPGGDRIATLTLYPVVSVGPRGHVTFAVAPTASGDGPEGLFAAAPPAAR
ncbi:MAG: DUF7453 family protein [Candidatus Rokuibacteriota bacterium]